MTLPRHHPDVEQWRGIVAEYWTRLLGIAADLPMIVIYGEARGDRRARNKSSNAKGLMQHLNKYWESRFWQTVAWLKAQGVDEKWMKGRLRLRGGVLTRVAQSPYHARANIAVGAWLYTKQGWGAWRAADPGKFPPAEYDPERHRWIDGHGYTLVNAGPSLTHLPT